VTDVTCGKKTVSNSVLCMLPLQPKIPTKHGLPTTARSPILRKCLLQLPQITLEVTLGSRHCWFDCLSYSLVDDGTKQNCFKQHLHASISSRHIFSIKCEDQKYPKNLVGSAFSSSYIYSPEFLFHAWIILFGALNSNSHPLLIIDRELCSRGPSYTTHTIKSN